MGIVLSTYGIETTMAHLATAADRAAAMDEAMDQAVPEVVQAVQGYTPVLSGQLRDSIGESERTHSDGVVTSFISSSKPYVYWINYGHYYGGRPGLRRAGPAYFFQNGARASMGHVMDVFKNVVRGWFG